MMLLYPSAAEPRPTVMVTDYNAYQENEDKSLEVGYNQRYKSISSALEDAGANYIVRVYPGIYKENEIFLRKKNITLIGVVVNGEKPIIEYDAFSVGLSGIEESYILIRGSNCSMENLIIRAVSVHWGPAIDIESPSNQIKNCEICRFPTGILVETDGNIIEGNKITGDRRYPSEEFGIDVNGRRNVISSNTITNSDCGIDVDSSENKIFNNTLSHNKQGIKVLGNDNRISENEVNYNSYGIFIRGHSSENILTDNEISDNAIYGIMLASTTSKNEITRNVLRENQYNLLNQGNNNVKKNEVKELNEILTPPGVITIVLSILFFIAILMVTYCSRFEGGTE